jgi:hypothetical protein
MQDPDAIARSLNQGAVVALRDSGGRLSFRPAAFVFLTATGFGWVEPSYADPAGTPSPALHYRDGTIEPLNAGFACQADGERVEVLPYEPDDTDLVGDALDWFAGYVRASGRTWDEERARVLAVVEA